MIIYFNLTLLKGQSVGFNTNNTISAEDTALYARCSFSIKVLHSRMLLDPTPIVVKRASV
jgi:hypothetical protein